MLLQGKKWLKFEGKKILELESYGVELTISFKLLAAYCKLAFRLSTLKTFDLPRPPKLYAKEGQTFYYLSLHDK
jgi:hypothetical protein